MKRFLLSIFLLLSFFATSLFAVTPDPVKNDEGEASKTDPNRSFETYTSAELREYIAKLPQTETDPEVLAFEKLALNSSEYLRSLEMSLYYQGWNKDVFYQFENLHYVLTTPTNKQMREGKSEVRNAQKAFLYALLSKALGVEEDFSIPIPIMNLCYLYYEGIGTSKNYKRLKELYNVYIKSDDSLPGKANLVFFYYLFLTGECGFEKRDTFMITYFWRNLYAGFLAPQKKDFIIELLSSKLDFSFTYDRPNPFFAYNALIDIYSGKYDKADADPIKKEFYEKKLKAKINETLNCENYQCFINGFLKNRFFIYKYMPDFYSKEILNPEYSKEKAIELFIRIAKYIKAKADDPYYKKHTKISFLSLCGASNWSMKHEVYQAINFYRDLNEALPKIKALAIFPEDDFYDIQAEVSEKIKLFEYIEKNYY